MSAFTPDELLEAVCASAVETGASDLILHSGRVPKFRVGGRLVPLDLAPLDSGFFEALRERLGMPESAKDFDTGFVSAGGHRFRVNFLVTMGTPAAILRRIPSGVPRLENLGVPAQLLSSWAGSRSGLVLVCGAAGSGKSTTLAALLDWMNQTSSRHIVTIEDPVEFAFVDNQCIFTQREVGIDTSSFAEGLRRSLRQNPDVILIGEIRDAETALTALQASETGHLVFATLHASSCAESMERMESLFTPDARDGIRKTLAGQLLGVLCQRLLPSTDGGQVVACEFFENRGIHTKSIAEGKPAELADRINRGDGESAQGFLSALAALVKSGRLSETVALSAAGNPQELQRLLRGVSSSAAGIRR